MLYAILAYHEEEVVTAWSPEEDAALRKGRVPMPAILVRLTPQLA